MSDILLNNWAAIALGLLAFLDIIVSLTPTKKDDQWVGYLRIIIQSISGRNRKRKKD